MKCDLHLIEVITLNTVFSLSTSTGWLTAVSSSLTMSRLYIATRSQKPISKSTSMEKKPLDPIVKNILCYFIGNSGYFRMKGYKPVDTMPSILLQNETIDVFIVHTRKTVPEDVFPCIVVSRTEDDTTAFKFYISGEYDLGSSVVLEAQRIVGRFLFTYENDMFYCDALAEEPALSFSGPEHDVEKLYLKARNGYYIADDESVDPLCGLNFEKKLRICTIVMNSNDIASKQILFFPEDRNVQAVCERRRVREMKNAEQTIHYQEWMMACVAQRVSDNIQMKYYISRAYNHNQVFVYTMQNEETGNMILENLSLDVRLVVEAEV